MVVVVFSAIIDFLKGGPVLVRLGSIALPTRCPARFWTVWGRYTEVAAVDHDASVFEERIRGRSIVAAGVELIILAGVRDAAVAIT